MTWSKIYNIIKFVAKSVYRNFEVIKSVLLIFLIMLSLIMTWSLWTLKPNYSNLEETRTLKKAQVTDTKKITDVIRPSQIIYYDKNSYRGMPANDNFIERVNQMLENTKFYESRNRPSTNIDEKLKNKEYIEVIYPTDMTADIYSQIFNLTSSGGTFTIPSADRVIFYKKDTNEVEAHIISYTQRKMITASTTFPFDSLKNIINNAKSGVLEYEPYDVERDTDQGVEVSRRFYFPKQSFELNSYSYLSRSINSDTIDRYKNALFRDPGNVKSGNTGEYYTDESSALDVNRNTNRIKYTNFTQGPDEDMTQQTRSPLFNSVDFINNHAGWGNPYYFYNLDPTSGSVEFLLFVRGIPVIKSDMEMKLGWTNNELNEYQRSLVELVMDENEYSFKPKKVKLQSAAEVKAALKDYDMSLVNKLAVGYEMTHARGQENVYNLQPKWFVNYGPSHDWQPLFRDSQRPGGEF
ncbi:Two-component signal transduction system YycFG, regulatory protein YycH [Bacillus sp. OV194]|nr:Two-component signal transduction system YycFG, regulatory protein YycH [Bacillus sp. OV194]